MHQHVHVIFSGYLSQIFVGHHTRDIRKSVAMFVEYSRNIFRKYSLDITPANIREYSVLAGYLPPPTTKNPDKNCIYRVLHVHKYRINPRATKGVVSTPSLRFFA